MKMRCNTSDEGLTINHPMVNKDFNPIVNAFYNIDADGVYIVVDEWINVC